MSSKRELKNAKINELKTIANMACFKIEKMIQNKKAIDGNYCFSGDVCVCASNKNWKESKKINKNITIDDIYNNIDNPYYRKMYIRMEIRKMAKRYMDAYTYNTKPMGY